MKHSDWSSARTHLLKSSAIVAGVVNFFADFLTPIAPFGLYIAAIAMVLFLLAVLAYFAIPKDKHPSFGGMWFAPLAISMLIFVGFSYGAYTVSAKYGGGNSGDANGVLARLVPGVEEIQKKLGILDEMNRNLKDISDKVGESNVILADVASSGKAVASTSAEVSENTAKMAQLLGDQRNPLFLFIQAIQNQDVKKMTALIDGGEVTPERLMASGFYEQALLQQLSFNNPDVNAVTLFLFSKGIFDVNQTLDSDSGHWGLILRSDVRKLVVFLQDEQIKQSATKNKEMACNEIKGERKSELCESLVNAEYAKQKSAFSLRSFSMPVLMLLKMRHREDLVEQLQDTIDWKAQVFKYQDKTMDAPVSIKVSEIDSGVWKKI